MVDDAVEQYLADLPEDRRDVFMLLHQLVFDLYPDCDVDMQYKMPTYHYGDGWIAIADQKQYVSLYTCDEQYLAGFKQLHPGISTGKGCINFNPTHIVPMVDVSEIIRQAFENPGR